MIQDPAYTQPAQPAIEVVVRPASAHTEIASILAYWFERPAPIPFWFGSSDQVDAEIKSKFSRLVDAAACGELDDWQKTSEGSLALLILLDQFPRNLYRGRSQAFSTGQRAKRTAIKAIGLGQDRKVPFLQQAFFYLPLEHDEDALSQVACVALTEGLAARAQSQTQKDFALSFLNFAKRHQDVIAKFNRYPSRNEALGRASSAEETAFLKTNPMGF